MFISQFNKMVLSVIIPSYRFENYILDCLSSVLSQETNFEFEVLFRDDFSGDSSEARVMEKFGNDSRLRIFKGEDLGNIGAFQNIKFLIGQSRGKYIAYLDGDDCFDNKNKLQEQVDFLNLNSEYSMHSTGYRYIDASGALLAPCDEGGRWLYPLVENVSTEDLLEKNQVGFGRIFRNFGDSIMKEKYSKIPYVDWIINFECSLRGKIKCVNHPTGFYRITLDGMYSKVSDDKKEEDRRMISEIIKKEYESILKSDGPKTISIIDCFIHDKNIEVNLINLISKLKSIDQKILLISNTTPNKEVIDLVDYFFYDSRNQLFKKEYPGVIDVDFWTNHGSFTVHNLKSGLQKHGLSVLINLFNALKLAKSLGYTHFQRFETDDLFGPKSLQWIKKIPLEIHLSGKRGLFYINPYNRPPDASFHYFYCEIDTFLEYMPTITSEEDYERFLLDVQGTRDFKIVEEYLYNNIGKAGYDILDIREGKTQMSIDFPDTVWNTVVSSSNLPEKYKGCVSGIYKKINQTNEVVGYCLYTSSYLDKSFDRLLKVNFQNGEVMEYRHTLAGKGSWYLNDLPGIPHSVDVYDSEDLLYSQEVEESKSYIRLN